MSVEVEYETKFAEAVDRSLELDKEKKIEESNAAEKLDKFIEKYKDNPSFRAGTLRGALEVVQRQIEYSKNNGHDCNICDYVLGVINRVLNE